MNNTTLSQNSSTNQAITLKFLSCFNYKYITIFALPHPDLKLAIPASPFFHPKITNPDNTVTKAKISHAFRFHELQNPDTYNYLQSLQSTQKRTINFTLHETDGQKNSDPLNPNQGEKARFTTLKALCIDTDRTPIDLFTAYLKKINLQPHITVESSPNRFHIYFLLNDTPITPETEAIYKAIQKALHQRSDPSLTASDSSMLDIPQQMKLPGFLHIKKSHLIKPVKYSNIPRYNLNDVYTLTNAHLFHDLPHTQNGVSMSHIPYALPSPTESPISSGSRHHELTKLIGFCFSAVPLKNPLDPHEDIQRLSLIYAQIHSSIANPIIFLPKNYKNNSHNLTVDTQTYPDDACYPPHSRHESDTLKIYKDLKEKEIIKYKEKLSNQLGDLTFPDSDTPSTSTSYTPLSSDFYFQVPGIAGKLMKELHKGSIVYTPVFWLVETLIFLGLIKSKCVISDQKLIPCDYFACFGGSGSGKKYAQTIYSNAAYYLGLDKHIISRARGGIAVAEFLASNNSIGVLSLDESSTLFTSFRSLNPPPHVGAIKDMFLELYTAHANKKVDLGCVVDKKAKKGSSTSIVFHNPHFSISAYAVKSSLEDMFDTKAIAQGLFSRFLIFSNNEPFSKTIGKAPASELSKELLKELQEYKLKYRLKREDILLREQLYSVLIDVETSEQDKEIARKEIEELENTPKDPIVIKYTPEARKLFDEYDHRVAALIAKDGDSGVMGPIYSRLVEHVGRLNIILADDVIDAENVRWCVTLVDNMRVWIESMILGEDATMSVAHEKKDITPGKLSAWIDKYCANNKTRFLTFRDLQMKFTRNYSHKSVEQSLFILAKEDRIKILTSPTDDQLTAIGYPLPVRRRPSTVIVRLG